MNNLWRLGLVLLVITQAHCGGNSDKDGPEEGKEHLSAKTTFDGRDQIVSREEYFYEGNAEEPTRVEVRKPDRAGELTIAEMIETERSDKSLTRLVVHFNLETKEEQRRRHEVERFVQVGDERKVASREVRTEADGKETTTETRYEYGDDGLLLRQKLSVNDVPELIEEWDYDSDGRLVKNRVLDGDRQLQKVLEYDWQANSFSGTVYNSAGDETEAITGKMVYTLGRVIAKQEKRVGQTLEFRTECDVVERNLTCSEVIADRISGIKNSENLIEVALAEKGEARRPIEEKHQRFDDQDRILLVADDWDYRADEQVKSQVHQVDAASNAALTAFKSEFPELYDFRLTKEYSASNLPVRDYKETDDPVTDRRVVYKY